MTLQITPFPERINISADAYHSLIQAYSEASLYEETALHSTVAALVPGLASLRTDGYGRTVATTAQMLAIIPCAEIQRLAPVIMASRRRAIADRNAQSNTARLRERVNNTRDLAVDLINRRFRNVPPEGQPYLDESMMSAISSLPALDAINRILPPRSNSVGTTRKTFVSEAGRVMVDATMRCGSVATVSDENILARYDRCLTYGHTVEADEIAHETANLPAVASQFEPIERLVNSLQAARY